MGEVYVGLLAATILFLATNAGLIGVSRLVYSMGIHRQLPDRLRQLHPKYRTPWIGILLFSAIAIGTILPGQEVFLGNVYAFGALLSFTMAHASVARLGRRRRTRRGPTAAPATCASAATTRRCSRSWAAPSPCIAFIVISVLYPTVASFGVGWLVLGVIVFIAFRRRQGLDLSSTHKVAIAQPVVDHEAEYDSVLVHFGDGGYDDEVLATARKLAARKRRGIHVLVTITVPNSMDIDARDARAGHAAAQHHRGGQVAGGGRVSGHVERVRAGPGGPAHRRGRRDMRAAAIVMPLPRRVDGASLFGKTLETVLDRAAVPRDHRVQPRRLAQRAPDRARGGAGPVSARHDRACRCRWSGSASR